MDEVSYLAKRGRVEHLHDHGRHAAEGGDLLALDQLEGACGVEVVHHDDLPAGPDVPHHDRVTAGGVEERYREQDGASAGCRSGRLRDLPKRSWPLVVDEEEAHQVGADVAMGADGALGPARRARGVEDGGVVLGVDGDVGRRRRPRRRRPSASGERPFGDRRRSVGRARGRAGAGVVHGAVLVGDDQRGEPAQAAEEGADALGPLRVDEGHLGARSPPARSAAPRRTTRH